MIFQNTYVYPRIYRHISNFHLNSLYLTLLVSQNKLSRIRKDSLKYKLSKMNFDFEISRVDFISKENYYSPFNIENKYQSLEPPSSRFPQLFSAKSLITSSTPGICKQNIFSSVQWTIHSRKHVDHLTKHVDYEAYFE